MSRIPAFTAARTFNLHAFTLLVALVFLATVPVATQAQPGTVRSHQKISNTEGNFTGPLGTGDHLGIDLTDIGDLDGDGVRDLAVAAPLDDDGGRDRGAVWVLFLDPDGTVNSQQKISATEGNFTGTLDDFDMFGRVSSLGDLDGDGVTDLAVGADLDDDGGTNRGAVWILFLNSDGTVREHQKISDTEGGFDGVLDDNDQFGWHVTTLRDFDNDGNPELAVGAFRDDDGAVDAGAVWILFLNSDGTVKGHQKISGAEGGFTGDLDPSDWFGHAAAPLGDLDEDGVGDLAVGAFLDDDGGTDRGAVWILFLNSDGTVKAHQKISTTFGGFTGDLDGGDFFGRVWELPDMDGDQVQDLAVGAPSDDDGALDTGAVWILFLNRDGTVKGHQKISDTEGGFTGGLDDGDYFGYSGAFMGDLNGDTRAEMAVGAVWDDDGGPDAGAVWMLSLDPDGTVNSHQKISATEGGFTGDLAGDDLLDPDDRFGANMTDIGDFDGDGVRDLAVGAPYDDDGGTNRGAVWLLFLNSDGTVKENRKINDTQGGFEGVLDSRDFFGRVASLGDLDGDGVIDLAVGAQADDDGGTDRGAVWILFLNSDGTVKAHQKISATEGGFTGGLDDYDNFGWQVTTLRDFDNDGNPELAVGALFDDDGAANAGAVWILFLNRDGTVKGHQKISATEGGFTGNLDPGDGFGHGVAPLGDLDEDGVGDLAVGARRDDDGVADAGAVWILFLNSDGTVKQWQKISARFGGFTGNLDSGDSFSRVWELPDMDGDQVQDLAVGADGDDDGALDAGAVWVLFLNRDGTVKGHQKISATEGGFTGVLDPGDRFGVSGAFMGDLNGDTRAEMAVGARVDDDGGINAGAVWMLFLNEPPVPVLLQDFRAIAQGTSVELQWMLATDEPISAYRVLRSAHGSPYAPIFEGLLDPGARTFRDSSTEPGTTYQYILEVTTGWGTVVQSEPALVTVGSLSTRLGYNTPNPFNPKTTIEYSLAASANVALRIYDSRGVLVRTLALGTRPAGSHRVEWNGEDESGRPTASGVYFYRLEGEVTTPARRMLLLK